MIDSTYGSQQVHTISNETAKTQIQLSHGLQQGPISDAFNRICQDWNKRYPNWQIEVQQFSNYGEPVTNALQKAPEEQPSLVLAPEFQTGLMMGKLGERKVIPIDQLLDKEQLEKIAPLVRMTFGTACLPFNPACPMLFYNKDKVGERPLPKTFADLEKICQELESAWTCAWPAAYLAEIPAAQQNYTLAKVENGVWEYQLNREWFIKHLTDLKRQSGKTFQYAGRDNNAKIPFLEGRVTFFMQGSSHYKALQSEAAFEISSAALPTLTRETNPDDKYALPLGGAAFWVLNNPNTQKAIEGVRAFLNYLASDDVQEKWHKETAYVPVSSTLPEKLQDFYKENALHQAVVDQTINAKVGEGSFNIKDPNYPKVREAIVALIEKVINTATPEEAIPQILDEFEQTFNLKE